jgi:glutamine cyclotransferase
MKKLLFAATILLSTLAACNGNNNGGANNAGDTNSNANAAPPVIQYAVVNKYPHDTSYFTEGLEFFKGQLFESSGGNADESPYPSEFGIADLKTGKVASKVKLDKTKYFGEGITFFGDKMYHLTWTSHVGFVYDANTFKLIKEFKLPAQEGWGLTHDSTHLIMSDGSSSLYYLTPDSLNLAYIMRVTDNNGPVTNINELEYINGYIYANQWETTYILKIDAETGNVVGKINLENLQKEAASLRPGADVLNGIAYNKETGQLLVTGKRWPYVYEIKVQ